MVNIVRGAVFLANLNPTIGSEQKGYRPVLVVQNNIGNKYSPTTVIVPFSSQKKWQLPTHIFIRKKFLKSDSIALVEQIRVVDKKRLVKYLGKISNNDMKKISNSIIKELGIT